MSESCDTCRYWRKPHREADNGECRRLAPQPTGADARWAWTKPNEWCGEHRIGLPPMPGRKKAAAP